MKASRVLASLLVLAGVAAAITACTSAQIGQNGAVNTAQGPSVSAASSIYDFKMKDIDGKDVSLNDFKGKVLLVVHVAACCANTPKEEALKNLSEADKDRGFAVLGFPSNEFGQQ